jgi:hypothetical protein
MADLIGKEAELTRQQIVERLIVAIAPRILTECDNVKSWIRDNCQCEACSGTRIADSLRVIIIREDYPEKPSAK